MRALAICGSPRKNGNTEILLDRALSALERGGHSTRMLRISDVTIKPCGACGSCQQTRNGTCALTGDDFPAVFQAMREADILLVGSPVYFGSATPQLMALLDRSAYVARSSGNLFSRKLGGPIAVARRAGQNFTLAQLLMWYMINDLVVPGSSYWNMASGRMPGEVEQDEEALQTVDRFAENLLWLAEKLERP